MAWRLEFAAMVVLALSRVSLGANEELAVGAETMDGRRVVKEPGADGRSLVRGLDALPWLGGVPPLPILIDRLFRRTMMLAKGGNPGVPRMKGELIVETGSGPAHLFGILLRQNMRNAELREHQAPKVKAFKRIGLRGRLGSGGNRIGLNLLLSNHRFFPAPFGVERTRRIHLEIPAIHDSSSADRSKTVPENFEKTRSSSKTDVHDGSSSPSEKMLEDEVKEEFHSTGKLKGSSLNSQEEENALAPVDDNDQVKEKETQHGTLIESGKDTDARDGPIDQVKTFSVHSLDTQVPQKDAHVGERKDAEEDTGDESHNAFEGVHPPGRLLLKGLEKARWGKHLDQTHQPAVQPHHSQWPSTLPPIYKEQDEKKTLEDSDHTPHKMPKGFSVEEAVAHDKGHSLEAKSPTIAVRVNSVHHEQRRIKKNTSVPYFLHTVTTDFVKPVVIDTHQNTVPSSTTKTLAMQQAAVIAEGGSEDKTNRKDDGDANEGLTTSQNIDHSQAFLDSNRNIGEDIESGQHDPTIHDNGSNPNKGTKVEKPKSTHEVSINTDHSNDDEGMAAIEDMGNVELNTGLKNLDRKQDDVADHGDIEGESDGRGDDEESHSTASMDKSHHESFGISENSEKTKGQDKRAINLEDDTHRAHDESKDSVIEINEKKFEAGTNSIEEDDGNQSDNIIKAPTENGNDLTQSFDETATTDKTFNPSDAETSLPIKDGTLRGSNAQTAKPKVLLHNIISRKGRSLMSVPEEPKPHHEEGDKSKNNKKQDTKIDKTESAKKSAKSREKELKKSHEDKSKRNGNDLSDMDIKAVGYMFFGDSGRNNKRHGAHHDKSRRGHEKKTPANRHSGRGRNSGPGRDGTRQNHHEKDLKNGTHDGRTTLKPGEASTKLPIGNTTSADKAKKGKEEKSSNKDKEASDKGKLEARRRQRRANKNAVKIFLSLGAVVLVAALCAVCIMRSSNEPSLERVNSRTVLYHPNPRY